MPVYTDGCHLTADTSRELHAFAKRLDMTRKYYYITPEGYRYYLLEGRDMEKRAYEAGAVKSTSRQVVAKGYAMELNMHKDERPGEV